MTAPPPQPREQEQSIRERKRLLFEDDEPMAETSTIERKPFVEYLRTTPAAPLSVGVRAALWGIGAVVVLLLLAALWQGTR